MFLASLLRSSHAILIKALILCPILLYICYIVLVCYYYYFLNLIGMSLPAVQEIGI